MDQLNSNDEQIQEADEQLTPEEAFAAEMNRRRELHENGEESLIGKAEGDDDPEIDDDENDDDEHGDEHDEAAPRQPSRESQADDDDEGDDPDPQASYESMINSLPEGAKETFDQLQAQAQDYHQKFTSLYGRLAPIQRENQDLKNQLQEMKAARTNPPTPKDLEASDAWKEVSAEFPDEAGALKNIFGGLETASQEARREAEEIQRQLDEERKTWTNREMQRVSKTHEDFLSILKTPHFQTWRVQLEADPNRSALARQLNSDNGDEVAAAISTYKKQFKLGKNKPANEGNQQSTRQQASAANNGRRKPTVSPQSQGAGITGQSAVQRPMTDRQAFAKYMDAKKRDPKKQRRKR